VRAFPISLARARIRAAVAPGALDTQVWVEFGRRGATSGRTAARLLPAAGSARTVTFWLSGLQPGRRYSFRVVAASAAGTTTGPTLTFGTAPRPRDERGRLLRCTIVGTNGPDLLVGTRRRDVICGLGGADQLVGLGGDDILVGGPGADYLRPGGGRDRVLGGAGNDLVLSRDGSTDVVIGGPGRDRGRLDRRIDVGVSVTRAR
jgi:hypothetical protein